MLLKISLALAILGGLATLYFTSVPLKGKIDDLNTQIATTTEERDTALQAQAKAEGDLKTTKANLDQLASEYKDATNLLQIASTSLDQQQKRADTAMRNLASVTEERNEAQRELNKWSVVGIPVEKVTEELNAKRQLQTERDVLASENKIIARRNTELANELRKYQPDPPDVRLPAGTKGRIVAVDPKYDFVVLDIGANQGLLEDAKMLVNRDGKLVAKVKITHVEPNRAIANIMPEWKQDDVIEGDQVVY